MLAVAEATVCAQRCAPSVNKSACTPESMTELGVPTIRLANETDLGAWQHFVDSHPEAGCMHHAGWFLVLRDAFRVTPRYLLALDSSGAIQGILPTYHSRSWLAGDHISSLEDGVLARAPNIAGALLSEARVLRDAYGARYLQIRGGAVDGAACFSVPTVRTVVTTAQPADVLWAAIKKKTRWALRQTEKQPFAIEHDSRLEGLDDFYIVYSTHMRDLGTPVIGLDAFRAMRTHLGIERLRLYLVKYNSRLIGGMICIAHGDHWTDYFAAVHLTRETEFANYLLYWHVIRDAAQLGISHLDLGRSTPGSGVHLFKRKWGGVDAAVPYRFYVAPHRQPHDLGLQRLKGEKGLPQRLWSRLPLPVSNRLGPLLRKQLPFI